MARFERALQLDLPEGQSVFLWGARQTGKTRLLRKVEGIRVLPWRQFLEELCSGHLMA